jgi:hypothetical protein
VIPQPPTVAVVPAPVPGPPYIRAVRDLKLGHVLKAVPGNDPRLHEFYNAMISETYEQEYPLRRLQELFGLRADHTGTSYDEAVRFFEYEVPYLTSGIFANIAQHELKVFPHLPGELGTITDAMLKLSTDTLELLGLEVATGVPPPDPVTAPTIHVGANAGAWYIDVIKGLDKTAPGTVNLLYYVLTDPIDGVEPIDELVRITGKDDFGSGYIGVQTFFLEWLVGKTMSQITNLFNSSPILQRAIAKLPPDVLLAFEWTLQ